MDSVKGHQRGSRTLAVCFNFCLHSITHNFFFAVFFICQPAKQCRILSMTNRHSTNRTVTGRKAAGNALTTWLQIDQWSFLHMSLQWKKRNFFFFVWRRKKKKKIARLSMWTKHKETNQMDDCEKSLLACNSFVSCDLLQHSGLSWGFRCYYKHTKHTLIVRRYSRNYFW